MTKSNGPPPRSISGKSIPGRGDGLCKGPGVQVNLSCSRNRKRARVAGIESQVECGGTEGRGERSLSRGGCEDHGGSLGLS